jgi:hypothetical protein
MLSVMNSIWTHLLLKQRRKSEISYATTSMSNPIVFNQTIEQSLFASLFPMFHLNNKFSSCMMGRFSPILEFTTAWLTLVCFASCWSGQTDSRLNTTIVLLVRI